MEFLTNLTEVSRNIADLVFLGLKNPMFCYILAGIGSVMGLSVAHRIWYRSARRLRALETERAELKKGDIRLDGGDDSVPLSTGAAVAGAGATAATVSAVKANRGEEVKTEPAPEVRHEVEEVSSEVQVTMPPAQDTSLNLTSIYTEEPGDADDLTRLEGIDEQRAADLQRAGIYKYAQLEDLDEEQRQQFGSKFGWSDINWGAWAATAAAAAGGAALLAGRESETSQAAEISAPAPTVTDFGTTAETGQQEIADTDIQITTTTESAESEVSAATIEDTSPDIALSDSTSESGALPHIELPAPTPEVTADVTGIELGTVYTEAPEDADDLTQIEGIDEATAAEMNRAGIYKISQLQDLDEAQRAKFGEKFKLPEFNWAKWGTIGAAGTAVAAAGASLLGKSEQEQDTDDVTVTMTDSETVTQPLDSSVAWEKAEEQEVELQLETIYSEPPEDADDLTLLEGIDEAKAAELQKAGIYKFSQLEELDEEQRELFAKKFEWPDINWGKWAGFGAAGAVVTAGGAALFGGKGDKAAPSIELSIEPPAPDVDHSADVATVTETTASDSTQSDLDWGYSFKDQPKHADDLTQLEGISEEDAARLNAEGVYTFHQFENLPEEKRREVKSKFIWSDIDWGKWGGVAAATGTAAAIAVTSDSSDAEGDEDQETTQSILPPDASSQADEGIKSDWTWGYTFKDKPENADDLTQADEISAENEAELNRQGVYTFEQLENLPEEQREEVKSKFGWGDIDWSKWATAGAASAAAATPGTIAISTREGNTGTISGENVWEAESNKISNRQPLHQPTPTTDIDTSAKYGELALTSEDFKVQIAEDFSGESVNVHPRHGITYLSPPAEIDDLTKIRGIGLATEKQLNSKGIYRFKQIANWNTGAIEGISTDLDLGTRIREDEWISQAKNLASGDHETEETIDNTDYASIIGAKYPGHKVEYKKGLGVLYHEAPADGDDLTEINGVGTSLQAKLNDYGIYRFRQIADWNEANIAAFNDRLSFSGRIERDEWVTQSQRLAARAEEEAKLEADTTEIPLPDVATYESIKAQFAGDEDIEINPELGVIYTKHPKQADDLKQIWGVGSRIENELNHHGIYRFAQIANWNDYNVKQFNDLLKFKGRIQRDEWIPQAKKLAEENDVLQGRYGALLSSQFTGEPVTVKPGYGVVYTKAPDQIDDLTEINGIGPLTEQSLNDAGIYTFKQIANWDQEAIDAFEKDIDFPGRVNRDDWIGQAQEFSSVVPNAEEEVEPEKPGKMAYLDTMGFFDGENVDIDDRYGIIYTGRPTHQDDLKRIRGIGKYLEGKLNGLGIYRFQQIANWSEYNRWALGKEIGYPGRIVREDWISQAEELADLEDYRIEAEKLAKTEFADQKVRVDPELGVVYRKRPEVADDLTQLDGIDDHTASRLNSDGIYTFEQLNNLKGPQKKSFASRFGLDGIDWSKWAGLLGIGAAGAAAVATVPNVISEEIKLEEDPPVPPTPDAASPPPPAPAPTVDPNFEMEPKGIFGTGDDIEDEDGSDAKRRVVFVMDVSRSLTPAQLRLSKTELSYAVKGLPEGSLYQVIFFSGPTWFAHQRMVEGGSRGEDVIIADDGEQVTWTSGFGGFEYQEGNENLPVGEWRVATQENIEATMEDIEAVGKSYGTTWHLPLTMALNLEPAPKNIYFLTDGETARQDQVAEEMIELAEEKGGDTKINTIALMVPGASVPLDRIAKGTGGEYALVIAGGKVLKDQDLKDYLAEKDISLVD